MVDAAGRPAATRFTNNDVCCETGGIVLADAAVLHRPARHLPHQRGSDRRPRQRRHVRRDRRRRSEHPARLTGEPDHPAAARPGQQRSRERAHADAGRSASRSSPTTTSRSTSGPACATRTSPTPRSRSTSLHAGGDVDVVFRPTVRETHVGDGTYVVIVETPPIFPGLPPGELELETGDGPRHRRLRPLRVPGRRRLPRRQHDLRPAGRSRPAGTPSSPAGRSDDAIVNIDAIVDITGNGHVDATSNGNVTVVEPTGDLQVGHIESTGGDVTLIAPESVLDWFSTPGEIADVIGTNINIVAGTGGISGGVGTPDDFLEIDIESGTLLVDDTGGTPPGLPVPCELPGSTALRRLHHRHARRPAGLPRRDARQRVAGQPRRLDPRRQACRGHGRRHRRDHRQHDRPEGCPARSARSSTPSRSTPTAAATATSGSRPAATSTSPRWRGRCASCSRTRPAAPSS